MDRFRILKVESIVHHDAQQHRSVESATYLELHVSDETSWTRQNSPASENAIATRISHRFKLRDK
jgi:hypothetical protein